jgi:nicotinate-nucleotide pyrophosphorylase (carboxylating)
VSATRKTTPGLRALEKYAVVCGGGRPHRLGLFDAVLIKDNHLAVVGNIAAAVSAARAGVANGVMVEVEVTALEGLAEAIAAGADTVLLDNMDPATVAEAVRFAAGRVILEASGGITPTTSLPTPKPSRHRVTWLDTHSVPAGCGVGLEVGLRH